jgi:hypothetical protein
MSEFRTGSRQRAQKTTPGARVKTRDKFLDDELILIAVEFSFVRPDSMLPVIFRMMSFTSNPMSFSIPSVIHWIMLARGFAVELPHEQTDCEQVGDEDRLLAGEEDVLLGKEYV